MMIDTNFGRSIDTSHNASCIDLAEYWRQDTGFTGMPELRQTVSKIALSRLTNQI